jgi:hypothetical protein
VPPRVRSSSKKWIFIAGVLAGFILLVVYITRDSGQTKDLYSPQEWRDLLAKAGGWTPLPFPDSKFRPGSIIKVMEDGIRWIDDLEACRFPLEEFGKESYIPSITFTKKWEFEGGAILNFQGVQAGPKFGQVAKVRMEVKDHGADVFRVLKLRVWMENPDNREKVSRLCMDQLLKPDYYLITEAFRVSKAKYTLHDRAGTAIKIEAPALKEILQIQPDLKYELTGDGALIIEKPAYFAVRKTIRVGDDFDARGGVEEGDAKIEKLFLAQTGK